MEVTFFNLTNGPRVLEGDEPSTEGVFLPKLTLLYKRQVKSSPDLITFDEQEMIIEPKKVNLEQNLSFLNFPVLVS